MYVFYNPNPANKRVGDCVIRALSKVLCMSWDEVAVDLSMQMLALKDMPSSDAVWGEYAYLNGFRREILPNTCPNCYTVKDFCFDHPRGCYLLSTTNHVIAVVDGDYYDTQDTGNEVPVYYWRKER